MIDEIPFEEFMRDIEQQREKKEVKKSLKQPYEIHPEALSGGDYDRIIRHGRYNLRRPRPVWLSGKEKWTVGAPVNPIEWQILIQSERGEYLSETEVRRPMLSVCGWFRMPKYAFSECVSRLQKRNLLKTKDGFRRSKIADKWIHPDLTGQRAGGEWHRDRIHDFINTASGRYGCYTYADRGFNPSVQMPDVIAVRPKLDENVREAVSWDWENPIYAEFKSAQDMRNNPSRLKSQLELYDGIPLFLEVEDRVNETRDMLEERGRREVRPSDLFGEPDGDMVCLHGYERSWFEKSFEPVMEKIKRAFRETYDRKARLKKTVTDPQGREHHDLILYDKLGTPKNVGQVIPKYAVDVEDFAEFYFKKKYLGRITTIDYVYTPSRKPTYDNKTWCWNREKTRGSKFRSFSV